MSDTTPRDSGGPSRRTFLKFLSAAPAVGWLVSACGTEAATGADGALAPGATDALGTDAVGGVGATGADAAGGADIASGPDGALVADVAPGSLDAALDAAGALDAAAPRPGDTTGAPGDSGSAPTDGAADVGPGPGDGGSPDGGATDATDAAQPALDAGGTGDDALVTPDAGPAPTCTQTGPDLEGPYYIAGAPFTTVIAGPEEPGPRLFVAGTVSSTGTCAPVAKALVDVWQADASGAYHDDTTTWRLRGQMLTGPQGQFAFETIVPGRYAQSGSFRPAHIHFMVSAPGHLPITTQLYFEGDPYLQPNDPCSTCQSDDETHIVPLVETTPEGPPYECVFQVVLRKSK